MASLQGTRRRYAFGMRALHTAQPPPVVSKWTGTDFPTFHDCPAMASLCCSVSGGIFAKEHADRRGKYFPSVPVRTSKSWCAFCVLGGKPAILCLVLIPKVMDGCTMGNGAGVVACTVFCAHRVRSSCARIARLPGCRPCPVFCTASRGFGCGVRPARVQPWAALATSAAKSSSFFSIPSPTARRAKPSTSTPASLAASATL